MGSKSRNKRPLKRNKRSAMQIKLSAARKALKEAKTLKDTEIKCESNNSYTNKDNSLSEIHIGNHIVIKEEDNGIKVETTETEVCQEELGTTTTNNNANNICILCLNNNNLNLDDPLRDVREYRDIILVLTGRDINNLGGKYPIKGCSFCIIDLDRIKEVGARIINAQISLQNYTSDINEQFEANVCMTEKDQNEDQMKSIFNLVLSNSKRPTENEFQFSMKAIREFPLDLECKSFNARVPLDVGNGDNHHLYECIICDSSFEHGELLYYHHVIVHRGASCQCCGGKFKSLQSYLKHIYDTTANGENGGDDNFKWIKCTECNSFVTNYFTHLHKLQHQSEENHFATKDKNTANNPKNNDGKLTKVDDNTNEKVNNSTNIEQNDDSNESDDDDDSTEKAEGDKEQKLIPMLCDICGLMAFYKFSTSILRHAETHEFVQCETCGLMKTKAQIWKHKQTHDPAKFVCKICGKKVIDNGKLIRHLRTHTGEKPFSCTFCDRTFSSKWNRDGHLRLHTNALPYKCTQCNEAFRHNVTLKKHIIMSH